MQPTPPPPHPPASENTASPKRRFNLKYAARLGKFIHLAGNDPIDQIKFISDQGFQAFEDSLMQERPLKLQEDIGNELGRLNMQMGTFVATAHFDQPTFAAGDKALRELVMNEIQAAIVVAKRLDAKWFTVVPGTLDHTPESKARRAAAIASSVSAGLASSTTATRLSSAGLRISRVPPSWAETHCPSMKSVLGTMSPVPDSNPWAAISGADDLGRCGQTL